MKKNIFVSLSGSAMVCLLLAATPALAQSPGTGGPTPNPAAVPFDGGASLLLASGVALGLRKLRAYRKAR